MTNGALTMRGENPAFVQSVRKIVYRFRLCAAAQEHPILVSQLLETDFSQSGEGMISRQYGHNAIAIDVILHEAPGLCLWQCTSESHVNASQCQCL